MADIPLTNVAGGSSLPRLAPDLTWPSTRFNAGSSFKRVSGINAVGVLTTALSATGRFSLSILEFASLNSETITIKLTIDGVVIWNDTYSNTSTTISLMGSSSTAQTWEGAYIVNSSLLVQLQTTADASCELTYRLRPIL